LNCKETPRWIPSTFHSSPATEPCGVKLASRSRDIESKISLLLWKCIIIFGLFEAKLIKTGRPTSNFAWHSSDRWTKIPIRWDRKKIPAFWKKINALG
jgi:hypothetical protein